MRKVTIKQNELLEVLRENRETHKTEYDDAYAGYLETCKETLTELLEEFEAGERETVQWTEFPPQTQVKEYDRVIRMLELSVDSEIELTAEEFANYVQDEWHWKGQWELSNSNYITKTRSI
jgi:hypothetical protein